LGEAFNWRIVFGLSAILALICLIPLFRLNEPSGANTISIFAALSLFVKQKWALLVVGLAFVEGALVLGLLTLLASALEFQGVATSWAGLSVGAYGVATLAFIRFVPPLRGHLYGPGL